jgi:uncharacterized protein YndB with AHSA1/START domain
VERIQVTQDYEAPIERVWACYTDHRGWSRWARLGRVTLAREGSPTPDGTGCIRVIGPGPFAVQEEVLEFEPPRRMVYSLVKGMVPIRDHRGEVTFTALAPARTRVTWRCQFESMLPLAGPLIRTGVSRMFAAVLLRMTARLS